MASGRSTPAQVHLDQGAICRTIVVYLPYGADDMSTTTKLTLRLPEEDVAYVKAFARKHGLTVTEVIDRYLRRMRRLDQRVPSPEIARLRGLVPREIDVKNEYQQYLVEKHDDSG